MFLCIYNKLTRFKNIRDLENYKTEGIYLLICHTVVMKVIISHDAALLKKVPYHVATRELHTPQWEQRLSTFTVCSIQCSSPKN